MPLPETNYTREGGSRDPLAGHAPQMAREADVLKPERITIPQQIETLHANIRELDGLTCKMSQELGHIRTRSDETHNAIMQILEHIGLKLEN